MEGHTFSTDEPTKPERCWKCGKLLGHNLADGGCATCGSWTEWVWQWFCPSCADILLTWPEE